MEITIDTHPLIWYVDRSLNHKLSKNALSAIDDATANGIVYIPSIIMIELMHLIEKGKINLDFEKVLADIESSENYRIVALDTELIKQTKAVQGLETHDRIICATALLTNSSLVTKDREIRDYEVKVIW